MADIADTRISGDGTPTATAERALAYALGWPGRVLTAEEAGEIVAACWDIGPRLGIDPAVAFAQACHETAVFTYPGQVKVGQRNIGGIGATNDGAAGISNPTWRRAVEVFCWHLLAWTGNTLLGAGSPRYAQVRAAIREKGVATTWRSLGGRWAVRDGVPWQEQATMPGNYGEGIARHHAAILAQTGRQTSMATARAITDRTIGTLRGRGVAVYDLRGKLPVNADPARRYGPVRGGPGGVAKLIQHWTGDAFGRATLRQITGTDYGGDRISERMTMEDEVDLLTWYANFHIGRDGGTWGGIAYGIMVLPSGRVYVNWDLGTLTYHAFSVNADSYALCCPASNGQDPTPAQLVALNQVWRVLCEETPEIPAGWGDLWGHSEARRFDERNQTSCPGPGLLAHVGRARATGAPTVALTVAPPAPGAPGGPAAPPAPASGVRVAVPGGREYWIIEPVLSHYRGNGALARYGWPQTGLFVEDRGEAKGLPVQYFERARLEVQPDGTVTEGRLGTELLALRGAAA